MTRKPGIADVKPLLVDRLEDLARELAPLGRRDGQHWVDARRNRGGLGDSFKVTMAGPRRGRFDHYATGEGGDVLALVGYVKGLNPAEALAWATGWLGLGGGVDAETLAAGRAKAEKRAAENAASAARHDAAKRKHAKALWLEGQASIAGTPAEAYLLGRGIDLKALGRQPAALRFHPACRHDQLRRPLPALVAAITAPGQGHVATHRTWLVERGGTWDRLRKGDDACEPDGKRTLARYKDAGGFIALWRGATGRAITAAAPGDAVTVSEGIEDGLTAACADPARRVLCAVSIANFAGLALPGTIRSVTFITQNDGDNPHVTRAIAQAVVAHRDKGRRVFLTPAPPDGIKDINDMARGAA